MTDTPSEGPRRTSSIVWSAVAVCVATWLGSELTLALRFPETGAAILFPPYAVLTAALLLTSPREWWIYVAASFIGHMLVDWRIAEPSRAWYAAGTEVANAIRALVAAELWRLVRARRPRLDTFEDTAILLVIAGLLAPLAGAIVGALMVLGFGAGSVAAGAFWRVCLAWFLANAVAGVTLLPLLLSAAERLDAWRRRYNAAHVVELLALGTGLIVVSVLALRSDGIDHAGIPVRLVPLPFLLWAATRFGPGVTSAALIVVTGCAIGGLMTGSGPFAAIPPDDGVLALYLFLAFLAVPCLLLAALVREREQALMALREAEQRYRLATSAATVGLWDWKVATGEVYSDPVITSSLGYRDDEVEHSPAGWQALMHPADRTRLLAEATAYVEGRAPKFELEFRMMHKNGSERWFFTRGGAAANGQHLQRVIGTTIDITDRKRTEMELQERRRELSHLGRVATIGQLSGALAHELRQPLTAILTNAQTARVLLSKKRPNLDELRVILAEIEEDDVRASEVISSLRQMLKKGESSLQPLHLRDIVQGSLDIAHADIVARAVAVERRFDGSLPQVRGDRVELQQVMVNLVLNACEAMGGQPLGERQLTVGTTCDDTGLVVAYVTDRGTGIIQRDPEQVFQPFVTSKEDGLGLGLAICQTIASSHQGRLWATNNPGGGATFFLGLPPYSPPGA